MDLERHENILIISHQATIRCMYAYFMGLTHEQLPYARIPLHTIIELKPKAFGCEEKLYKGNQVCISLDKDILLIYIYIYFCSVDVGAVDTFRPKGQTARKLANDKFVSAAEGASGEIADASKPILPISTVSSTPC